MTAFALGIGFGFKVNGAYTLVFGTLKMTKFIEGFGLVLTAAVVSIFAIVGSFFIFCRASEAFFSPAPQSAPPMFNNPNVVMDGRQASFGTFGYAAVPTPPLALHVAEAAHTYQGTCACVFALAEHICRKNYHDCKRFELFYTDHIFTACRHAHATLRPFHRTAIEAAVNLGPISCSEGAGSIHIPASRCISPSRKLIQSCMSIG